MSRLSSFTNDPPPRSTRMRREPMFHRVFRADGGAIRAALIEMKGRFHSYASPDAIGRLELALAEVLNNISEHGGDFYGDGFPSPEIRDENLPHDEGHDAPTVHLCVIRKDNGLICAVTDDGVPLPNTCLNALPFQTHTQSAPFHELPVQDLPEGGFGWSLIQGLTHSMCYFREDQRNVLAFTVPYASGDGHSEPPNLAASG